MTRREQLLYFITWAGGSATRLKEARRQVQLIFPTLSLEPPTDQEWDALCTELQSYRLQLASTAYKVLNKSRQARHRVTGQPLFESPRIASNMGPPDELLYKDELCSD